MIYLVWNMPCETRKVNKIEIFNEITILIVCFLMTTLLNIEIPPDLSENVGWMIIGVSTFGILVNLALVCQETLGDVFSNY